MWPQSSSTQSMTASRQILQSSASLETGGNDEPLVAARRGETIWGDVIWGEVIWGR